MGAMVWNYCSTGVNVDARNFPSANQIAQLPDELCKLRNLKVGKRMVWQSSHTLVLASRSYTVVKIIFQPCRNSLVS